MFGGRPFGVLDPLFAPCLEMRLSNFTFVPKIFEKGKDPNKENGRLIFSPAKRMLTLLQKTPSMSAVHLFSQIASQNQPGIGSQRAEPSERQTWCHGFPRHLSYAP